MIKIFADASALVALNDLDDADHSRAVEYLSFLDKSAVSFYTSTFILAELTNILCRNVDKAKAVEALNGLRSNGYAIIAPNENTILKAEKMFRNGKSKGFSYTDFTSFAIMQEFDILWSFSFDLHFKKQGFKRLGVDGWPK